MKQHTEEELQKLAKKKLNLEKLKDEQVVLHPEISKWRDKEKPDIQMLRSLNTRGQIQAVTFRELKDRPQLLAGARRYAHMKLLGWTWDEIKKDVREKMSDRDALILAIEENLRRKNLTVMEEARAVISLLKNKMSIKNIAKLMGQSPSWVSSRKNLFALSEETRSLFEKHGLAYGYSVPLRKLGSLPEAQATLIEKIVEGRKGEYYGIKTIEKAEEFVTQILKQIKDKEDLLLKYGACPACASKDISKYGDEHLNCENCNHSWHGITKEPWEYYEVKQNLERMGIEVEEGPEKLKLTPKDVADMIKKKERQEQEEKEAAEEELPKNFRSKATLTMLLKPMLEGDNIQKLTVRDEKIEIQLIEGMDLYFDGLRKDYADGVSKARIMTAGWGGTDSVKKNHAHVDKMLQAAQADA